MVGECINICRDKENDCIKRIISEVQIKRKRDARLIVTSGSVITFRCNSIYDVGGPGDAAIGR